MENKEALFNPIREKVFKIRNQYVMLDSDLAGLYGVETKVLNQAVKRNIERFEGEDFMFELTQIEYDHLRSQFVTANSLNKSRVLPYAFTDNGLSMLSSVLNSPLAIRVNRQIMRYFNHIRILESRNDDFRKYVETNFKLIEQKLKKGDTNFEIIFSLFDSFKKRFELPAKSTMKYGFIKAEEKKNK
ncbi:MAG: hypothetical protein A2452_09760 [Candidatus Firestonebacteria bacterium RIFOXYC2_FULL_39_67]|nr:MAG: hypothetical protein A2536_04010 [Candidatus Firestonebacteria bacterium RIFOXYD2_FULL_39_29]OGF51851.1 MAG: hypothetical protein A2497_00725 [Candidatus Firestonebacteria bacterium RifOxyC12_full_39_7]OGF54648.1 MAG: hypothetical protein A2452_09760 [Candidatus Firestonebacteria bacterium RIFOXYC2_FULL_39_67]